MVSSEDGPVASGNPIAISAQRDSTLLSRQDPYSKYRRTSLQCKMMWILIARAREPRSPYGTRLGGAIIRALALSVIHQGLIPLKTGQVSCSQLQVLKLHQKPYPPAKGWLSLLDAIQWQHAFSSRLILRFERRVNGISWAYLKDSTSLKSRGLTAKSPSNSPWGILALNCSRALMSQLRSICRSSPDSSQSYAKQTQASLLGSLSLSSYEYLLQPQFWLPCLSLLFICWKPECTALQIWPSIWQTTAFLSCLINCISFIWKWMELNRSLFYGAVILVVR